MKNKLSLVMFMLCLMASVALAQTDAATGTVTNDATQARLRIGNFVSSSPRVDVFIDGEIAMNGTVPQANMHGVGNGYIFLAPGTYSVAVAPAHEGIEKAQLGPLDVTLEAGHRYTLGVLDKALDEEWTPLLIDETTVLQDVKTSPSQSILFLVNNLSGTETINFDQDGEGPKEVAYGSFGAAPITVGQGKTFVYAPDTGKDIPRYGLGDS